MIDKNSIIHNKAKISESVEIGPYSVIGPDVEIKENVIIHSHVNISGNTLIGKGNKIYPFASIGNDPQDLKFKGEKTKLIIGNNNTIREYVTINPGTKGGGGQTIVGDNCLLMIGAHIAHDCKIGNNVCLNSVHIDHNSVIQDNSIIGYDTITGHYYEQEKMKKSNFKIIELKPVEPYKGKGIKERGQYVLRKEGKKK